MKSWLPRLPERAAQPDERSKMERKSPKRQLDQPSERYYTTTEAAKICGLSHRTIAKLFDAGLIKGYRLPGSGFRRIPEKELLAFIAAQGMPASGIESSPTGAWLHCWEYRKLRKQSVARCKDCEIRLSHTRHCWRFSGSALPVCRYGNGDCLQCHYYQWASPLAKETPPTRGR